MLHEVGLTATELRPGDYTLLHENGIGLIDLAEYVTGEDAALRGNALYAARLRDVVEAIQPRALAFNGKTTAGLFYRGGAHRLSYGANPSASARPPVTCCLRPRRQAPFGLLSLGGG